MHYELLFDERLRHRSLIRGHAHEIHAVGKTGNVDLDRGGRGGLGGRDESRPYGGDDFTVNVNYLDTIQYTLFIVHCTLTTSFAGFG